MKSYKPNNANKIYLTQFSVVIENRFVYLPYSTGCVWAYAEQQGTVNRNNLGGLLFIKHDPQQVLDSLENPAVVGFSHYVWNENYNDTLAQMIKQRYPECVIVYGGPQVSDEGNDWYDSHKFVDVFVHQEGEITFNEILKGIDFANIGGISYHDDSVLHRNGLGKRIQKLEDVDSPYLIGLFDDMKVPDNYVLNAVMENDRGCPYRCTFCDWGSLTFSKVKRFSLERVFGEIEWAGRNQIETINNASANFGIFKERDNMIADKLVETNAKYGYPKMYDPNWAKNSNQDVLDLAIKLKEAGLMRKFGISMQSLDSITLENIKRSNLKINDFADVIKEAERNGISVMIELIVGLPGETYDSWTTNYCYLMQFENTTIENYPCSLLNNSELNTPESLKNFDIKYRTVDFGPIASHHVNEDAKQIVSTYSMPESDMKRVWAWTWCARLGHTVGITSSIVADMRKQKDFVIKDFYENWYEYIRTSTNILNEKFMQWNEILEGYDFTRYIFDYEYMDDIGYLRRPETLQDLHQFLNKYYAHYDTQHLVDLFDMMYYTPAYNYPYTRHGKTVNHGGMHGIYKYSSFIGLNRKNSGWKCSVLTKKVD